jgi:hypothetical protein
MSKITAKAGHIFKRKHDGFVFGSEIYLGKDYSTGSVRDDKIDHYEEIKEVLTGLQILLREKAVIEEKIKIEEEKEPK